MATSVLVQDSFFSSAYELPKEIAKKVFKSLRNFLSNPGGCGLHQEKLNGVRSDLWSLRVDQDYRIIFHQSAASAAVFLFVGKHDVAYRFAKDLSTPLLIPAALSGPGILASYVGAIFRLREPGDPRVLAGASNVADVKSNEEAIAVRFDDLDSLVKTRKYLPLARLLIQKPGASITLSFQDIERCIGESLPVSARKYRPWWANENSATRSQALSWMTIGRRVEEVDIHTERVRFSRKLECTDN